MNRPNLRACPAWIVANFILVAALILAAPGLPAAPQRGQVIELSPPNLTFSAQQVGTSSPPQTMLIINTSSARVTISSVTITGHDQRDFAESNNTCPHQLAGNQACSVDITFTPTALGTRSADLTVSTGRNNVQGALTGTGSNSGWPMVMLSPTILTFSPQVVGTTSATQSVMLTNTGNAALNISSLTSSSSYGDTSTCGSSVAAGASCTISVAFSPAYQGPISGTVTLVDNANPSTQTIALSGSGIPNSGGPLTLTPANIDFGNQIVLTTSPGQTSVLTNTGGSTVNISQIIATAGFGEFDNCPSALRAGDSCTLTITFSPPNGGLQNGSVIITDDALGSPQSVGLTGVGIDATGNATSQVIRCPQGRLQGNSTCYNLTISCPEVQTQTATLKVTLPPGTSIGTTLWASGTGGVLLYENAYIYGITALQNVLNANYTVAQIGFDGATNGWLQGPGGPRKLACRYAAVTQWVYDNIHQGNKSLPMCATGSSGGGGAVAYGLAHYGLASILSLAEPTSGPPFARVDNGCICNQAPLPTTCGQGTLPECYGVPTAKGVVDPAYANSICSDATVDHSLQNQALFLNDSVNAPDGLFTYPKTDVHLLFGGLDNTAAVPQGLDWMALITTKNDMACVPSASHSIPDVKVGAEQIATDVISFCKLQ